MNPFDANRWYQINSPLFPKRSLVGLQPHDPDSTAKVFFKLTNESLPGRQWQLFPTDTNTYILRSKLSGPDAYLALRQDDDAAGAKPRSIAATRNVDTASSDVLWKITNFPNGHYKLVNVANGTGWHLHAEDRQNLSMTNNIGEQDNQKFDFTAVGQTIDNATFSSIRLPSGAYATLGSSPSPKSTIDHGDGHKTAIGVSVGLGVSIIVAAILGIYLLSRRRHRKRALSGNAEQADKQELDATQPHHKVELAATTRGSTDDSKPTAQELNADMPSQELDGTEIRHGFTPMQRSDASERGTQYRD